MDMAFGSDNGSEDDYDEVMGKGGDEKTQNDDLKTGIVLGTGKELVEEIVVMSFHKEQEARERTRRIEELKHEMVEFQTKINEVKNGDDEEAAYEKRVFQMRMLELQDEIDELMNEVMTPDRFWGNAVNDEEEEFEYGRDVLKEQSLDL